MSQALSQHAINQLAAELRQLVADAETAGTPLEPEEVQSTVSASVVFAAGVADEKILAGKQVLETLHKQVMGASTPTEYTTLQAHYQDAAARHEQELKRVLDRHNLAPIVDEIAAAIAAPRSDANAEERNQYRPGSFYFIGLSPKEAAKSPHLMQVWMKLGGAFDREILGDRQAFKAAKRRCKAIYRQTPKAPQFKIYASDLLHEDVPDLTYSEYTGLPRPN
jgi:hypothetical protein